MKPPYSTPYSHQDIIALIESDATTPQTRAVLEARLQPVAVSEAKVFTARQFETLQAVCLRLIPQPDSQEIQLDLPGLLNEKLNAGSTKGWRYDALPAERETFCLGMDGVEDLSVAMFNKGFTELEDTAQDVLLKAVQNGSAKGPVWEKLPARLFFEELIAALVQLYYSHPSVKASIGDVSFADAHGWDKIGLNEADVLDTSSYAEFPSIH